MVQMEEVQVLNEQSFIQLSRNIELRVVEIGIEQVCAGVTKWKS